jgi:hypothetical protein
VSWRQMSGAPFFVGTVLLGGLAIWLPSIMLHAVRGESFCNVDAVVLTGILPVIAVVAAVAAGRIQKARKGARFAPLAVGLGVWGLGPLAMSVSAMFSGGGFVMQGAWVALLALTALFPLTTFMMATYDGSLGGLLLGSAALALLFIRGSSSAIYR